MADDRSLQANYFTNEDGEVIKVTQDGSDYKLEFIGKVRNSSGIIVDPATESTLDAIRDNIGEVAESPTTNTVQERLKTVYTKLTEIDTVLDTLSATATSIKDTDGVKKITDPLAAGTNRIGGVRLQDESDNYFDSNLNNGIYRQEARSSITSPDGAVDADVGTTATGNNRLSVASRLTDGVGWIASIVNNAIRRLETRGSITSPDGATDADVGTLATSNNRLSVSSRLTDGTGWLSTIVNNTIRRLEGRNSITAPDGSLDVAVITDNSINRLETRSSLVGQTASSGSEKKVSVIDDVENPTVKRLQTQALLAPGSTVNIGTAIPADPANLTIVKLMTSGAAKSMLVDGSVTPVEFYFAPSAGTVIAVDSVLLAFSTDDMYFDGASFGPNVALINGIVLRLYINSVTTDIFTLKQNEDFLEIPGRVPVINNTGPKDVSAVAFSFGGLVKLIGDDGDRISFFVRDNLTSVKFKYLQATLYGAEV